MAELEVHPNIDIEKELRQSYLAYSLSVIIGRAIPDARDGLKPVHRRILYAQSQLANTYSRPHKKCARVVGDVIGKYHPHGDLAVYDSLVRLAQDFSSRYPFVDGHGNFGSVDGDGAAAMRYTEARLGKISMEMVRDIDKDTVDFMDNFDGSLKQPVTLPARFPNLLVNGTGGIAVGMATNIPPHNLGEVVRAIDAYIDNPDLTVEDLIDYIPGPDFPTGGQIVGVSGIRQAYRTGRGKIRVRAKAEIEVEKDGRERIVITEIPYQVNKEMMVANIRELAHEKRIEGIADANDESDSQGMRVVVDLKKGFNANVILNQLYKHTQMQTTFGVIMIALVGTEPKVLNLKEIIVEYVDYQREIITRRTRFDLEKAEKRAHIVEGLLKALDSIDEIIATIKASKDGGTARLALMERFAFSEVQAQAILDMRLQRLTGLERDRLEEEFAALMSKIEYYHDVLNNPSMVDDIIKEDLADIVNRYGDDRRTEITIDEDEVDADDLIQEEEMVVTLTHHGYIKRTASDNYRAQRRGGRGITALATKEEDFAEDVFATSTHNYLLFFTTKGKVYVKKCYQIPEAGRTAKGMAIVNLLSLESGEKVSAVFPVEQFEDDSSLVMVTRQGVIKKTAMSAFSRIRQNGLIAIAIREGDELVQALTTHGSEKLLVVTRGGMAIRFDENDVRPMGRTAAGVRAIRLKDGDEVVAAVRATDEDAAVLTVTENGYGKRTRIGEYSVQNRGGQGLKTYQITQKTGEIVGAKKVTGEEDILLVSDDGTIIRMEAGSISLLGRATQGVRLMRPAEGAETDLEADLQHRLSSGGIRP